MRGRHIEFRSHGRLPTFHLGDHVELSHRDCVVFRVLFGVTHRNPGRDENLQRKLYIGRVDHQAILEMPGLSEGGVFVVAGCCVILPTTPFFSTTGGSERRHLRRPYP